MSLTSMISPFIVSRLGTKLSLIIGAITYLIYVLADLLPVVCYNRSITTGICTSRVIYTEAYIANIITGIGGSLLWVAQGAAIKERAEGNATYLQGIFWIFYMGNNVIGNILSAILNMNKNLQMILYGTLAGFGILAIIVMLFIGKPMKENVQISCCDTGKSVRDAWALIFSIKLFPFLSLMFYKGALLTFFSGSFPRLAIHTMHTDDRFYENRHTSYLFFCQGVASAISGMAYGVLTRKIMPRSKGMITSVINIFTFVLVFVLYVLDHFDFSWYIAATLLGISDGTINTFMIGFLASEFTTPSVQFGAFVLFKGMAQFVMYLISSFTIESVPYGLTFAHICMSILGLTTFMMYKFSKQNKDNIK